MFTTPPLLTARSVSLLLPKHILYYRYTSRLFYHQQRRSPFNDKVNKDNILKSTAPINNIGVRSLRNETFTKFEAMDTKFKYLDKVIVLQLDTINKNIKDLDSKIDTVKTSLDSKIDTVKTSLDSKIDTVKTSLDSKIDTVKTSLDSKIDTVKTSLDIKIDAKLDAVDAKIGSVKFVMTVLIFGCILVGSLSITIYVFQPVFEKLIKEFHNSQRIYLAQPKEGGGERK